MLTEEWGGQVGIDFGGVRGRMELRGKVVGREEEGLGKGGRVRGRVCRGGWDTREIWGRGTRRIHRRSWVAAPRSSPRAGVIVGTSLLQAHAGIV